MMTGLRRWVLVAACVLAVLIVAQPAAAFAATRYVRTAGSDANDGLTVGTAKLTVANALGASGVGDVVDVGPGTFAGGFGMPAGVTLQGAGRTSTTLSGGMWGVVRVEDVSGAVIRGFTITGGAGPSAGGIWLRNTDTLVEDCLITANHVTSAGGGVYIYQGAPTIRNCEISYNVTDNYGGAGIYISSTRAVIENNDIHHNSSAAYYGGGIWAMWNLDGQGPTFRHNRIHHNNASYGGGVFLGTQNGGGPHLATFEGNTYDHNVASNGGGAVSIWDNNSIGTFVNEVMWANQAGTGGNAIDMWGGKGFFRNCTIYGNTGGTSAAQFSAMGTDPGQFVLTASIVRGNSGTQIVGASAVEYCDVQGGAAGADNFDAEPLFRDVASGDFRLMVGSPCIDKFPSSFSYYDHSGVVYRTIDGGIGWPMTDIGAHEWFNSATADPPATTIMSSTHPAAVWTANSTVEVTVTANSRYSKIKYLQFERRNGAGEVLGSWQVPADQSGSQTKTSFSTEQGTTAIRVYSVDHLSYRSVWTTYSPIYVDSIKPTNPNVTTLAHAAGTPTRGNVIVATMSGATDSGSGVAGYAVSWSADSGADPGTTSNATLLETQQVSEVLADGRWYFNVRTKDAVGNWSDTTSFGPYVIDTTPPKIVTDGWDRWENSARDIPVSASDAFDPAPMIETVVVTDAVTETGTFASPWAPMISGEADTLITVTAVDWAGNRSEAVIIEPKLDLGAPWTVPSHVAGWSSTPVTVTLSPDDLRSSVASTWYRLGSGPAIPYTGPFAVADSGETTVTYWSIDFADNREEDQTTKVSFDDGGPVVSDDAPDGWQSADTTVALAATDARSGVAGIDWVASGAVHGSGSVAGDAADVAVATEGVTTIEYSAVDVAGNRCATETAVVRIDKTAPSAMLSDAGSTSFVARLSLDGTDTASGVTLHWAIGVEPTQTLAGDHADIVHKVPGTFLVTAWAVDGAGNASTPATMAIAVVGPAEIGMRTGSKTLGYYKAPFRVSGVLTSGDAAVAGGRVELQKSSDGVRFYSASRYATTTADGAFSFRVVPLVRTIYRVRALSAPGRAGVVGPAVLAMPRALVGNGVTPAKQAVGKGYRVEGTLRPHHPRSTGTVRVYMWRLEGKKWVRYGYRTGKLTDYKSYSKYRAVIFPKKPGKWRVRVYHKDFDHAASWSSKYTYFRVY